MLLKKNEELKQKINDIKAERAQQEPEVLKVIETSSYTRCFLPNFRNMTRPPDMGIFLHCFIQNWEKNSHHILQSNKTKTQTFASLISTIGLDKQQILSVKFLIFSNS